MNAASHTFDAYMLHATKIWNNTEKRIYTEEATVQKKTRPAACIQAKPETKKKHFW